ncbi:MAG TPA: SdrD B-like domain-containing protein, partial [Bacteroidota bacterium]|nr:SdrD B-like domain-containing protein [Bacteroidota bacterium]
SQNAYSYRHLPKTSGGGGGVFTGYTLPASLARDTYATYGAIVINPRLMLFGATAIYPAIYPGGDGGFSINADTLGLFTGVTGFDPALRPVTLRPTQVSITGIDLTMIPFEIRGKVSTDYKDSKVGLAGRRIDLQGPIDTSAITDANGNFVFRDFPWGMYTLAEESQVGWASSYPTDTLTSIESYSARTITMERHLFDIAEDAYRYYWRPTSSGGGWGSFIGYTIAGTLLTDSLAAYQISRNISTLIAFKATETNIGGSIVLNLNYDGSLGVVFYPGPETDLFPRPSPGTHLLLIRSMYDNLPAQGGYTIANFGNTQPTEIKGTVFADSNGNGVKDPGENGIPGWKVYLSGPVIDSVVTDASGFYQFTNLPAGRYLVNEGFHSGIWGVTPSLVPVAARRDSVIRNLNELIHQSYLIGIDAYRYKDISSNFGGGASIGFYGYDIPYSMEISLGGIYKRTGADNFSVSFQDSSTYGYGVITSIADTSGEIQNIAMAGEFSSIGAKIVDTDSSGLNFNNVNFGNKFLIDTIVATSTGNGSISPAGIITFLQGSDQRFTFTPNTGTHLDSVIVDGVVIDSTTGYTFLNITTSHSIRVVFKVNSYTIKAGAGNHGGISPSGNVMVRYGDSTVFAFVPDTGYHVDSVIVDGVYQNENANLRLVKMKAIKSYSGTNYTFMNVTANHTINVTFAINQFIITASAGSNGAVAPNGSVIVSYGDSVTFSFVPNLGYHVSDVVVDGNSIGQVTSYKFLNVTSSHTIIVSFTITGFTITPTAGINGTISPIGPVNINYGNDTSFTIIPNTGYHIDTVFIDGVSIGAMSSHIFANVTANHTITAKFAINTYSLTSSVAGGNGTIAPLGITTINYDGVQVYTITPNTGYHIDSVFVDGSYIGNASPDTINDVTANHALSATFRINTYTITATAGANGIISPSGIDTVTYGSSPVFSIVPNLGYHIDSVLVDEGVRTAVSSDTLYNVTANHTIRVTFSLSSINVAMNITSTWNLVSLPVKVQNDTLSKLFPTRTSNAFAYNGSGYVITNQLNAGTGYWLKFVSATSDTLSGLPLPADTIAVADGWNLVGSLSTILPISSITSNPPGMVTSNFFGYNGSYKTSDTIYPGKGYWIKVNQSGTLILSAGNSDLPAEKGSTTYIRIMPTSELPPPPPKADETQNQLPKEFALEQNYPNPFNPTTTLRYTLPTNSKVTFKVYDVLGQVVATLVNDVVSAGYQSAEWNASDVASGIYFYRIEATSISNPSKTFTQVKKMLLLK